MSNIINQNIHSEIRNDQKVGGRGIEYLQSNSLIKVLVVER